MNKVVTFGEIMLRLSSPGFLRFTQTSQFDVNYAGAESNVAISLAQFGVPVDFVTWDFLVEVSDAARELMLTVVNDVNLRAISHEITDPFSK